MANLTTDRATQKTASSVLKGVRGPFPVPAAATIYRGLAYAIDAADGSLVNPTGIAHLVLGMARDSYDNTAGALGDVKAELVPATAKWDASVANAPVAGDEGKPAYFEDNHTVGTLAAAGSLGGKIALVEADGVWVEF